MVFGFWSPDDAMKQTIIKDNGPGGFYISFDARTLQEYHFGVVIGIRTHLKFTFLKKRKKKDRVSVLIGREKSPRKERAK